jgi:hypothetical protein
VFGGRQPRRLRRHGTGRSLHVMGRRTAAVVISAAATLWSTPGWAHTAGRAFQLPAPIETPATTGLDVSPDAWIVAAFAAIALLIAAAHRRKTLGAALIAMTLWMGFEAGAHSVHHLGQPSEEGRCAVASVTAHSSAIPSVAHACVAVLLAQTGIARDLEPAAQGHGLAAPHEGRAPPRLAL